MEGLKKKCIAIISYIKAHISSFLDKDQRKKTLEGFNNHFIGLTKIFLEPKIKTEKFK